MKPNNKGLIDTSTDEYKSTKNYNCETYDIYYFSIRVGKQVIRKSLHTYNKTLAIIIKLYPPPY